jgi:hypothetical protein
MKRRGVINTSRRWANRRKARRWCIHSRQEAGSWEPQGERGKAHALVGRILATTTIDNICG